ncbi:two-component system copper resistance phosphate regulon response regulator CusR [Filimonas zeae]|uniref:DNA-binding response regulator n=1 Tax=Filimonas zeae TaxID=1737353 RepID=A0A917MQC4_9BACT|nr:response regulator transcription factor [Filimonas zeae]MDR6337260.1 two-component system copper resistance phosphate regulon response regulator CusR [Filimonas zeae]GGH57757.1 DNA-binding response regulator [Filimonas zeae]
MENTYRILLAEDEPKLSQVIQDELARQGYQADVAYDGLIAEKLFKQHNYALVLLDINLPYKNGLALCKEFREHNKNVPIIMLTALGELSDKIDAFNLGADDYMVKPFHFDELFARIRVFLKRSDTAGDGGEKIVVADMEIDMENKMVTRGGKSISLTAKEFALLVLLSRNKGKVISKHDILEKVWELSFDTGTNTIEVYISFLRNKIDKPFDVKLIHTKPGFGYYVRETALS